jgi:hypothetical protein
VGSRLLKLVAVGALTLVGAVGTAAVAGVCTVTLSGDVTPDGTTTRTFPVSVVVSGDVPEGATLLRLYVSSPIDSDFVLNAETVPVDGTYAFPAITLDATADFRVGFFYGNQNAYTASCTDPSGADVIRIRPAGTTVARPLAFTGSSGTTSTVLIALAAIALGVVLVVASRRRHRVDV